MTDWNFYSKTYDLMTQVTPAYQALLTRFSEEARRWSLADGATILEIGAGTGNFALAAARTFPRATVLHTEPEKGMQKRAIEKAAEAGISNMKFVSASADDVPLSDEAFDAAILVHVLYTLPDPISFLEKLHKGLRPGAVVFACDFGRVMNVADWRRYLWKELIQRNGYVSAAKTMWRARGVFRSNEEVTKAQKAGRYWTHSGAEFAEAFRNAGFAVGHQETTYRGYSDLLIARKAS